MFKHSLFLRERSVPLLSGEEKTVKKVNNTVISLKFFTLVCASYWDSLEKLGPSCTLACEASYLPKKVIL